jgi:predicted transcriptional regulator of viral defense system
MRRDFALSRFAELDKRGFFVFTLNDLAKIFPAESNKTLLKSVDRLVASNILERAVKGIYVFAYSRHKGKYLNETIASVLRRGYINYISLECALSEYGAISQIPMGTTTIMTTGPSGCFETSYGHVIEFSHTKRDLIKILQETTQYRDAPIRIASPERAFSDLKRVGRNVNMVDSSAFLNSKEKRS